jgi:DNA-binding CsgD family transcriptional regulator
MSLVRRGVRVISLLTALGHANELIAYELGLAHSTVSVLLACARAKLGARTRPGID